MIIFAIKSSNVESRLSSINYAEGTGASISSDFTALYILYSIIRPYRSTTYVDATCCYRRSSVVCQSVCLSRLWALQNGWTDRIPFGMWNRVSPRKHC